MKKIVNLLAIMALTGGALTLASCGETQSQTVDIGVIMYSYGDQQGQTIKDYCAYLEENFNVKFHFEATNYSDDAQTTCVENLLAKGVKGIISGYDTNITAVMPKCEAAGVYYTVALDTISKSDLGDNAVSSYFLGGTQQFGGAQASLGNAYAEALLGYNTSASSKVTKVAGVSFPAWAFTDAPQIYAGFTSTLANSDVSVLDCVYSTGFTQADIETSTTTALTGTGADAIFGLASGLDYVYPVLQKNFPDVKLIALGYNDSCKSLMESDKLIACGNNNHCQSIASCFVRIMNSVDGKQYSDASSGKYNIDGIVQGIASYPVAYSASTLDDLVTYGMGAGSDGMKNGPVTAEELKKVMLSYNSSATLADLNSLTNRTVDEIKTLRK